MLSLQTALTLLPSLGVASAAVINISPEARSIHARDTVGNGSCISAPDTSCVSLVGLCVTKIATGQVGTTAFWSDNVCAAAATCATMGSVLDAACCAGTCTQPTDQVSLDYTNVYASIVGDCAFQSGGCSLTWQPFIDWFYNTIQSTGTNLWPASGDDVLAYWESIATWTGFCSGDNCVDGAIPYTNFNDWFHFSSAIVATAPGTPDYVPIFDTLEDNEDNFTPNLLWPCLLDDSDDCWWDHGPPPPGTVQPDTATQGMLKLPSPAGPGPNWATFTANTSKINVTSPYRFGRAEHQPANLPPPVYINGELFPLVLDGALVHWNVSSRRRGIDVFPRAVPVELADVQTKREPETIQPTATTKRAITPDTCKKTVDTPAILPTLTYYCPYFPGICANIRGHDSWDPTTDSMQLTYDPFDGGKRRRKVCTKAVRDAMQLEGRCDPLQHEPNYWKVSCDEFPFSSSLEGGVGNVVLKAVTNAEQDLQGTLQSYITQLRTIPHNGKTSWGRPSQCHRYLIKLVDTIPAGAPPEAIGSLDAGSAFFASGATFRYAVNKNVLKGVPPSFTVDTPYDALQTALLIPKVKTPIDCTSPVQPCPDDAALDLEVDLSDDTDISSEEPSVLEEDPTPSPTSPPDAASDATLEKRQVSCTIPTTTASLPTSSAEASSIAAASSDAAKAAAAAAAAALASAANPAADQAAAAAAAVSAADVLGPAADALAQAASDASLASAIAVSQQAVSAAQSALNTIFSFGPDIPDWLDNIKHQVSSSSSSVTNAIQSSSNVVQPATPVPPDVDPSKNPTLNTGPPAGAPPAACFGAGSQGFLKNGDTYFVNENGKAPATLVDVGSDAFFGLTLPTTRSLAAAQGCNGVYVWEDGAALQADFQVDCSTMELGSYWNGVKQACYTYTEPTSPGIFNVICGNSVGDIYACLQESGLYGNVDSAFINWATS
ncbi:hypothetical protein C8Q80DRAFT_1156547 [Daedaleopsis nitida]|nr:hypothetical protein C8Q80DRAFT_1156547 [Daedaleopsis nitida]